MDRRALLGAGLASAVSACGGGDVWEFRYRLKVTAFANQRQIEGESIFRTRYRYIGNLKGNPIMPGVAWGRAITLDFGDAGLLFGILDGIADVGASHAFRPRGRDTLIDLSSEDYSPSEISTGTVYERLQNDLSGREHAMPRDQWPLFVRFDDVRDATSARLVQVADQHYGISSSIATQTFEQAFGEDARITGVTLEYVTFNTPVGLRIARDLPCVDDLGPPDRERGVQRPLHELLRPLNFQLTGQAA